MMYMYYYNMCFIHVIYILTLRTQMAAFFRKLLNTRFVFACYSKGVRGLSGEICSRAHYY